MHPSASKHDPDHLQRSPRTEPRYDRLERHITLHTHPVRWSQITYQYAHELCHHAIPEDVPAALRWFEESLCEMASYYFLRKLGYLWESRNEPLYNSSTGMPFAPEFISYAVEESLKAEIFNLKDPEAQRYLANNCYDRQKNAYLANQLLPIFQEYPQTWLAVPYLCRVRKTSIKGAIEEWMRLSPDTAQTGLRWIYNLF